MLIAPRAARIHSIEIEPQPAPTSHSSRSGDAVDGKRVEVRQFSGGHGLGAERGATLARAAHVLEHGDGAVAEAAGDEAAGDFRDGGAVGRQHDQAHVRLDEELDVGGIAAVQRERVAVRQRPAHAGGGEREGRDVGDHLHLGEGDELHQLARHAVVHRIAGGEDDGAAAAQRPDAVDHRREGLRPEMHLGGAVLRQEAEEPRRADDGLGTGDGEAGARRQALPAILADADDGEPPAHCAPRSSALTTEAAMAEPPRRPSSVA